ncbi:hypothetical protein CL619_01780 [archaeon]|nr:hypothetical protein [archaeon]
MQDKILDVLKRGGPQVAPKVAREVKGEALITSAYLSELKAAGKVKISAMKIGTSPLYYLPGQEKRLALFADKLNSKDRAVFDKLEQLKVLREVQLDLLSKVALRKMKDFAIPLQVSVSGKKELFWRWYMLDSAETNLIVSSLLQQVGPRSEMQEVTSEALSTPVDPKINEVLVKKIEVAPTANVPKAATLAANKTKTSQVSPESELKNPWKSEYPPNTTEKGEAEVDSVYPVNTAATQSGGVFEDTVQAQVVEVVNTADVGALAPSEIDAVEEVKEKEAVEVQQKIEEAKETKPDQKKVEEMHGNKIQSNIVAGTGKVFGTKKEPIEVQKEIPAPVKEKAANTETKVEEKPAEKQKSLVEKLKETFMPKQKGKVDTLLLQVEAFCEKHKIKIESSEVIRKNSDLSLQLLMPTSIGNVLFFCKVRRKKRCDEKDISAAYMEAQVAKLPLLFLYTDDVSAKAKEFLDSGSFDNLLLMKLEVAEKK